MAYLEPTSGYQGTIPAGTGGDSPGGEEAELPQGRHPAWPGRALKVPSGHGRHSPAAPARLLLLKVPDGQGLGLGVLAGQ